jgi:hypothetical protein
MGFDILIDASLRTWLLEINDHPSLNIYFSKEFIDVKRKSDADICPTDLHVKATVVADSVNLARLAEPSDEYRSLKLIYRACEEHVVISKARTVFRSLTKIKEPTSVSQSDFLKLSGRPGILSLGKTKHDLGVVWQQQVGRENKVKVELLDFLGLILSVYRAFEGGGSRFSDFLDELI